MASVLIKCQQGLITVDELEKWAELIESREDIEFLESDSRKIKAIIYILANPEINGKVSSSILQKWLNEV